MRHSLPFIAFGALAVAATVFAAPAAAPAAWASGQIERFDAASRTVIVKQGTHEMTFVLAPDVHLRQGRTAFQPDDLARDVGRHVKVRYTLNAGTKLADRIELSGRAAAPPKTSPAKYPNEKVPAS